MTYLAKLRRLTDFEKTLGRLYMTVLDFSLLQSVTYDQSIYSHFLGNYSHHIKQRNTNIRDTFMDFNSEGDLIIIQLQWPTIVQGTCEFHTRPVYIPRVVGDFGLAHQF